MSDTHSEVPEYIKELTGLMSAYLVYTTGALPGAFVIDNVEDDDGIVMKMSFNVRILDEQFHAIVRSDMDGTKIKAKTIGAALTELAKKAARGVEDESKIITQ